jgi:hypothetical protein
MNVRRLAQSDFHHHQGPSPPILSTAAQRHIQSHCFLVRGSDAPLEPSRDHRRFVFSRAGLFNIRTASFVYGRLRVIFFAIAPSTNVTNESAAIVTQNGPHSCVPRHVFFGTSPSRRASGATQLSRAMRDLNGERWRQVYFLAMPLQWTPRNKLMTPNRIVQAMKTNSAAFMIMPIVSRRSAKSRRSISHFAAAS